MGYNSWQPSPYYGSDATLSFESSPFYGQAHRPSEGYCSGMWTNASMLNYSPYPGTGLAPPAAANHNDQIEISSSSPMMHIAADKPRSIEQATAPAPKWLLPRLHSAEGPAPSRRRHGTRHACPDCHKTFGRRSDRNRHVNTIHGNGKEHYHCHAPGCRHQNRRLDKIREHCLKQHGQDKTHARFFTMDNEIAEEHGCFIHGCTDSVNSAAPTGVPRRCGHVHAHRRHG